MSEEKPSILEFDQLANRLTGEKGKKEKNDHVKNSNNNSNNDDFIQKLYHEASNVKETKFKGYYLDKQVADKIDEIREDLKNKKVNHSSSYIVNKILRDYLEGNGYL